jgi:hypothetical protein
LPANVCLPVTEDLPVTADLAAPAGLPANGMLIPIEAAREDSRNFLLLYMMLRTYNYTANIIHAAKYYCAAKNYRVS